MALSGKKTVTSAGTEVVLDTDATYYGGPLMVKALLGNTGNIFIGGAGVSSTDGLELDAGDPIVYENVRRLSDIWIDAGTNGDGVTWAKPSV